MLSRNARPHQRRDDAKNGCGADYISNFISNSLFFFLVFQFPVTVLVISVTYPPLLSCFQEIDGRALLLLTQEMLESLTENKLGPMTKIQSAVKALKQAWGIWKYHEDNIILWTRQFYSEFQAALIRWLYNCFVVIIPKCFVTKYFIIFFYLNPSSLDQRWHQCSPYQLAFCSFAADWGNFTSKQKKPWFLLL